MALLRQNGEIIRRENVVPLAPVSARPDLVKKLRIAQREHIESALILCEGNRTLAERRLGITYRLLMRRMEDFRNEDMD